MLQNNNNNDDDVVSKVLKRKVNKKDVTTSKRKSYALGAKYGDAYFTKREAECMIFLLQCKTINKVAEILGLSPRTAEFYIERMKKKVGCRTRFELVDLIHESEFIKNIDASLQILM